MKLNYTVPCMSRIAIAWWGKANAEPAPLVFGFYTTEIRWQKQTCHNDPSKSTLLDGVRYYGSWRTVHVGRLYCADFAWRTLLSRLYIGRL